MSASLRVYPISSIENKFGRLATIGRVRYFPFGNVGIPCAVGCLTLPLINWAFATIPGKIQKSDLSLRQPSNLFELRCSLIHEGGKAFPAFCAGSGHTYCACFSFELGLVPARITDL
jgi:hypothetical protein